MTAEVRLVLDASNFARVSDGKSDLTRFFAVIDGIAEALDGRNHHLYIVWDSNYMRFFGPSARMQLEKWKPKSRNVIAEQETVQQGTKADVVVLKWAQERPGSIVLSSDVYREYDEHKHWLLEPGRFVCGTYTQRDQSWLLMERQIYQDGPGPITRKLRKLSDLLDDNFPTIRSMARTSHIQVGVLVKMMEESGHAKSETAILTLEECSLARSLTDILQQRPFSLTDIVHEVGKSFLELEEWVDVLHLDVESVGAIVLMDLANKELLIGAIASAHSEISIYRVCAFARDRDVQSLKRLSRTKVVQNSLAVKSLTECWIEALECESEFDLNLLLGVSSDLRLEIIEYLLNEKQIAIDESVSEELFKDASIETCLLVECARVLSLGKWKYLTKMLDFAETLVSEKGELPRYIGNHASMKSLMTNMSHLDFVRALKIPKNRLKTVSDRIERVLPTSIVPDVLRYESGQIEVLFANGTIFGDEAVDVVMADYLMTVGISWVSPLHLRGWKPTAKQIETMKAGNLSPLLSMRKVAKETIRSTGTLCTSDDEIVVLGLLCAVSAEISRLEDSLGDISKKMSRI
jgi:hypothetical protein